MSAMTPDPTPLDQLVREFLDAANAYFLHSEVHGERDVVFSQRFLETRTNLESALRSSAVPTAERILELAKARAIDHHDWLCSGTDGGESNGHRQPFETCPASDCILVRGSAEPRPASPPQRYDLQVALGGHIEEFPCETGDWVKWEELAMENIPEFTEYETEYDRLRVQYDRMQQKERERHGAAMFTTGVIEGLRQAIHAVKTAKDEIEPSTKWSGMNAAIVAIEGAIRLAEQKRDGARPASPPPQTLEVIVNGQPVTVAAGAIRDVIQAAITASGQIGAPIGQWELRTREGEVIPHALPGGVEYALMGGQRFFLNLGLPPHICTPRDNEHGIPQWDEPPHRTWCARCKSLWARLFAVSEKLSSGARPASRPEQE